MKITQAILYGARDLRLEEKSLNVDSLGPDEVYVETEVSALSTGTDLGNYLGDSTYVPGAPDYPRQLGYSNLGVVRRVGSEVQQWEPGQRVFSTRYHQSAFVVGQDSLLVPVPDGVSSEVGSLAYLTQLGMTGLQQVHYETGENVAVVGLGIIGLATVALARAMGARVVGIANSPLRAEAAIRVGAHAALVVDQGGFDEQLCSVFGEVGTDIVILTANPWAAYRLSVEMVRERGRVSILGFPGRFQPPPEFNPLDPRWLYGKQLTLVGTGISRSLDCAPADVRFNLRRNLSYILDQMDCGEMGSQLETLITHRLPASEMKEAYELATQHSKELIAAVFDWRQHT